MDKSILEEKKTVLATDYVPEYSQLYIHPEEGETFRINDSLLEINNDMLHIDSFLIDKANSLNDLLVSTSQRLNIIDSNIRSEQERLQDIKMLCNKFTDFDNVIPINKDTNMKGICSVTNDNTFCCRINNKKKITLKVFDVSGNGLEGNKYVYKDFEYVQNSMNTSNRNFITDDTVTSFYEYERITASPTENYLLSDFNTDSEEAICTISLYSEKPVNLLEITTDDDTNKIIGIQYSYDGIDYFNLEIPYIKLNHKLSCYENYEYICGDNKIVIPNARFIKVTFQSEGVTQDTLAYDRKLFLHQIIKTPEQLAEEDAADGIIGGYIGSEEPEQPFIYNSLDDETIVVNSAKRHSIKINDITGSTNEYVSNSYFTTDNLITKGKYYSVSLFLNAYIPSTLNNNCLEFIFNINGIDYNVTPINTVSDGIKIFRYSQGRSKTEYTQLLNEPITSLYLTIKFKGTKDYTPFVNNIKVLLGGDIND